MQGISQTIRSLVIAPDRPARVLRVVAGAGLMCLASQIRIAIPGSEVPMTLQSLGALLCGYFLSPGLAVAAILGYLALGAAGLPVFVGSAGLLGSTGGYLFGFVVCAGLVSILKGPSIARLAAAGLAGTVSIFACGLAVQVIVKGSFQVAFAQGVAPFAVKACVQLALAVALVRVVASRKYVKVKER